MKSFEVLTPAFFGIVKAATQQAVIGNLDIMAVAEPVACWTNSVRS
jgi:hypothetical protein